MDSIVFRLVEEEKNLELQGSETILFQPILQSHLLLDHLLKFYSEENYEVFKILIDLCSSAIEHKNNQLADKTQTIDGLSNEIFTLEKLVRSKDQNYEQSLEDTRIEMGREIERLRNVSV